MNSNDDHFQAHLLLAETLIHQATPDQVMDALKLLAIFVGYYQSRHGEVPADLIERLTRPEAIDDEARMLVMTGMRTLVAALAETMGLDDDLLPPTRH